LSIHQSVRHSVNHSLSQSINQLINASVPPVHPLHHFTQFTYQSIISWPSLTFWWHPIIHLLLSKQP